MAKIKEIYIECKKSKNFQTYTAGMLISLDEKEQEDPAAIDMLKRQYQAQCRKAVMREFAKD